MEKENKKQKKGKGPRMKFIIGGIIVAVVAGIIIFMMGGNTESTDNAQLDANIIPIRSSITGYVKEVLFEDNQEVKKGQLLVTIDDTEYKAKVAQAEAALENAKANLNAVKSNAVASNQNASAAMFTTESTQETINSAKTHQEYVCC